MYKIFFYISFEQKQKKHHFKNKFRQGSKTINKLVLYTQLRIQSTLLLVTVPPAVCGLSTNTFEMKDLNKRIN